MARLLELEPIRLTNGKWRVNVIAALSPTGKRQQLRFATKQAALAFIEVAVKIKQPEKARG